MMPTLEAKLARSEAKLSRLRMWVIILATIVVFFGILVPVTVVYFQQEATNRGTLAVTCANQKANISQLEALRALERRLGIPVDFKIPPLPEECM